jgi:predicted HicB family RNase H-like nuclease
MSGGGSIAETIKNGAAAAWPAAADKWNKPSQKKLIARPPARLHHDLTIKVQQQEVSLNTFIVSMLSRELGTF